MICGYCWVDREAKHTKAVSIALDLFVPTKLYACVQAQSGPAQKGTPRLLYYNIRGRFYKISTCNT